MLGSRLRELRLAKKLSLRQLGSQLGVSATYINQLEHDVTRPSDTRLCQLADILDTDLDTLTLLANRIPADILDKLQQNPTLLTHIRALK
jgi:transcriptional regulator with XRE-family HTH domain